MILTPLGYWASFRTGYHENCGSDKLVAQLGSDAFATFLVISHWIDTASLTSEEVNSRQIEINSRLEEYGEVVIESNRGVIILQTLEYARSIATNNEGNCPPPAISGLSRQMLTVLRMVWKVLVPARSLAVSTTVRMSASPSAAHIAR